MKTILLTGAADAKNLTEGGHKGSAGPATTSSSEAFRNEGQLTDEKDLDVASAPPKVPTKWKLALLTWLAVYPLIILLSTIAEQYLGFLPSYIRLLALSMVLVGAMTFYLMPKLTKTFAAWIFP